jgi:hypothetical protein
VTDSQADSLRGHSPTSTAITAITGQADPAGGGRLCAPAARFDGSVKKLMKPKCTTNAGQRIGVKVGANRRGDQAYFRLYCKVPGAKATGTRSTGRGDGSRFAPAVR